MMPESPVQFIEPDNGRSDSEPGTALCLSRSGYHVMVFHVGILWRLYEARSLNRLRRISSISGGSIAAGLLALKWKKLSFDPTQASTDFVNEIVDPIRALALRKHVDAGLTPGRFPYPQAGV